MSRSNHNYDDGNLARSLDADASESSENQSFEPDFAATDKIITRNPKVWKKTVFSNVDWVNLVFLSIMHAAALYGVYYALFISFYWQSFALGFVWACFTGLSITGGYHRLFSHKTYKAKLPVQLFYLIFGAAAVQNSALCWSADHRQHHGHTDQDEDPYNINVGFWWAHIGWVLHKEPPADLSLVQDLMKDPWNMLQHKYYVLWATLFGFAVPALIGTLWGDPLGAFLWAGCIRVILVYHATFCINSLAHTIGTQDYSKKNSAKDSPITALVTLGEGYHNFHHRFPSDYRNGIKAHHFDPTKWIIWTLSKIGMTSDLRKTKPESIRRAMEEAQRA